MSEESEFNELSDCAVKIDIDRRGDVHIHNCVGSSRSGSQPRLTGASRAQGACLPVVAGAKHKQSREQRLHKIAHGSKLPNALASNIVHMSRRFLLGKEPANPLERTAFRILSQTSPLMRDVLSCAIKAFDEIPPSQRGQLFDTSLIMDPDHAVSQQALSTAWIDEVVGRAGDLVLGDTQGLKEERPGQVRIFIAMLVATILFAIPLLIVAMFRSVARGQPWSARWPRIAGAIAVLVAGLYIGASPAWIHNYFIAHEPVMLSAHSGINLWIGNNPSATGYPKMPPGIRATQEGLLRDSITLAEVAAGRKLTRAEVSKYWSNQANTYILTHFSAWMRLMCVKFGNFWNAYQYDDLSIIKLLRDEGVLPPGLTFGAIAALGLAGLVPVLRRFPKAGWVAAAVLLHMCALMSVFITERYRLAAVPGLMILGAAGLWVFWENLVLGRWGGAAAYAALCAGAAWFVSIPRDDIGLWSLDHYKAGIRATKAGELEIERQNFDAAGTAFDRAQGNLETAYAYVPNNADIDFALGNLWLARATQPANDDRAKNADRTEAKLFYRHALELNPRHVGTLNNLGVLAMEEKRWPLAANFFSAALDAQPDEAKTHYLLARVYFESAQPDRARTELEKALRLRPNQREFLELRDKLAAPPTAPAP